jgi:WD40 repeat protein
MGSHFWHLMVLFLIGASLEAVSISPEPISVFYTLNSVLSNPPKRQLIVGNRSRWATCTDVRWSPDGSYLASLGLLDHTLWFYHFDGTTLQPISHYVLSNSEINAPEKLIFSPDGNSLAIVGYNSIAFFSASDGQHAPQLLHASREKIGILHDAAFTSDGNYFAYITVSQPCGIHLFKKEGEKLIKIQFALETFGSSCPKGIAFSEDNQFLIVVFARNAGSKKLESYLAVYAFNEKIKFPAISMQSYEGSLESVAFSVDCKAIYCADQALDRVLSFSFDPQTGALGELTVALQNPEACLSFPHGIGISPDGKYLAVSNDGDDKITIYEINE